MFLSTTSKTSLVFFLSQCPGLKFRHGNTASDMVMTQFPNPSADFRSATSPLMLDKSRTVPCSVGIKAFCFRRSGARRRRSQFCSR